MVKKIRSPTKKRGTDQRSAIDVVLFALQTSQRIIQWIVLLFVVHVTSNQVAVMVDPSLQESLNLLMEQTSPIYKLSISAYFGKAAIENVLKIWNSVKAIAPDQKNEDSSEG